MIGTKVTLRVRLGAHDAHYAGELVDGARMLGKHGLPNCRDNLANAIAEFGLPPEAVHDPLNIFMMTGVNAEARLFYVSPRAKRGDYIELYADMDCLCAISACPGRSSGPNPGGLKLQIFDIDIKT